MIDIENELFTLVSNKLQEKFKNIYITSLYVPLPNSFPCVSFVEQDNYIDTNTSSTDEIENHAIVMYEVNVYSNKQDTKKSECKAILNVIDEVMIDNNFTRIMKQPIPNELDATIYRITARYEAEISKDNMIYRR